MPALERLAALHHYVLEHRLGHTVEDKLPTLTNFIADGLRYGLWNHGDYDPEAFDLVLIADVDPECRTAAERAARVVNREAFGVTAVAKNGELRLACEWIIAAPDVLPTVDELLAALPRGIRALRRALNLAKEAHAVHDIAEVSDLPWETPVIDREDGSGR